jgi:drug/metabolite transporter (DMT)-like permease
MLAMIISATSRLSVLPERLAGIGALLLVAAILGFGNAIQKSLLADADPWLVMALRASIAVAVLAPLAIREWRKFARRYSRLPHVAWLVVASFAIGMCLQTIGANHTTASNLGFLINTYVIFMPLLVWLTGRGRPRLMTVLASLACFAGAGLLSSGSLGAVGFGDALCLGAALAYSIWVLALSRLGQAAQLVTCLTCLQWVPAAAVGFAGTEMEWTEVVAHLQHNLADYLMLGILASAFAFLVAAAAQQKVSACCASVTYAMEGVFGCLAAYVILGERLGAVASLGAVLIVCSIVVEASDGATPGGVEPGR